jgi:vesicular inhibitory amino acid transporter
VLSLAQSEAKREMEEHQPLLVQEPQDTVPDSATLSQYEAAYHIVCVLVGTGMLQLPYALSISGWFGLFLIGLLALVNWYTGVLIIDLLSSSGVKLDGFPQIGEAAFGIYGKFTVSFFYYTAMGGCTCLYLVLSGMNFQELFGFYDTQQWIIVLSFILLLPFLAVKTLKEVGFASFIGVFSGILVGILILIGCVNDYENHKNAVEHDWLKLNSLGSVLGTLCFTFGGNYVYPEVYRSMKDKDKFPKVLGVSVFCITTLYFFVAIVGYFTYGRSTRSPIFLNLPIGNILLNRHFTHSWNCIDNSEYPLNDSYFINHDLI